MVNNSPIEWMNSGIFTEGAVRVVSTAMVQCFPSAFAFFVNNASGSASRRCPILSCLFYRHANVSTNSSKGLLAFRPIAGTFRDVPITVLFAVIARSGHLHVGFLALRRNERTILFSEREERPMISSRQVDRGRRLPNVQEINGAFKVANRDDIRRRFTNRYLIGAGERTIGRTSIIWSRYYYFSYRFRCSVVVFRFPGVPLPCGR